MDGYDLLSAQSLAVNPNDPDPVPTDPRLLEVDEAKAYCSLQQPRLEMSSCYERRDFDRQSCGWAAAVRPVTDSESVTIWPGWLDDVSPGGLGLLLGRRYDKGTLLVVEFESARDFMLKLVLVRVVRVLGRRDGSWRLGCAATSRLDTEELGRMVRLSQQPRLKARSLAAA